MMRGLSSTSFANFRPGLVSRFYTALQLVTKEFFCWHRGELRGGGAGEENAEYRLVPALANNTLASCWVRGSSTMSAIYRLWIARRID